MAIETISGQAVATEWRDYDDEIWVDVKREMSDKITGSEADLAAVILAIFPGRTLFDIKKHILDMNHRLFKNWFLPLLESMGQYPHLCKTAMVV